MPLGVPAANGMPIDCSSYCGGTASARAYDCDLGKIAIHLAGLLQRPAIGRLRVSLGETPAARPIRMISN